MNDITVLLITDGRREYITQTVASAVANLSGNITRRVIHDDSGDPDYRAWLAEDFPGWDIISSAGRTGFGGAIANAWRHLRAQPHRTPFVFHLEDDFVFNRPVDLDQLAYVLDYAPYLAQMALRRQAWNDVERRAGGVIEVDPDAYLEVTDGGAFVWLEHRCFWTTNPSLYRDSLLDAGWPEQLGSEAVHGRRMLTEGHNGIDPAEVRFGYWGPAEAPPAVTHIGHIRVGTGYW